MNHHCRILYFRNLIPAFFFLVVVMLLFMEGVTTVSAAEPLNLKELGSPPDTMKETVQAQLYALPLSFIPNAGQVDRNVAYSVTGRESTLFFIPAAVVITARDGGGTSRLSMSSGRPSREQMPARSSKALTSCRAQQTSLSGTIPRSGGAMCRPMVRLCTATCTRVSTSATRGRKVS
jgi:hypothetical protein